MVEYSIVIYFALYSLALISIGVVLHIILSRDKKNANKPLPTKQAKVMEHKECFDFYYNTMKTKFKFWFTSELLPKYITNKGDEISRAMVIKIEKKFVADVLKSLHRNILTRLLEEYYSDKDSLIRAIFSWSLGVIRYNNEVRRLALRDKVKDLGFPIMNMIHSKDVYNTAFEACISACRYCSILVQ
jgi:hypothetical protein